MARVVSIRCDDCDRRFGGTEGFRKHRARRGDVARCRLNQDLFLSGWTIDVDGVWHRPVGATATRSAQIRPTESEVPSLFDVPPVPNTEARRLARSSDPETSKLAAQSVAPRTGTVKAAVLRIYAESDEPLTDRAVAARLGMEAWQVSKRVSDLVRDQLIESVGVRDGERGVKVRVCRAVTEAVAM